MDRPEEIAKDMDDAMRAMLADPNSMMNMLLGPTLQGLVAPPNIHEIMGELGLPDFEGTMNTAIERENRMEMRLENLERSCARIENGVESLLAIVGEAKAFVDGLGKNPMLRTMMASNPLFRGMTGG